MSTIQKVPVKVAAKPSTSGGNKIAQIGEGKYVIIQSGGVSIPLKLVDQKGKVIQVAAKTGNSSTEEQTVSPTASSPSPTKKYVVKTTSNNVQLISSNPTTSVIKTEKPTIVGSASSVKFTKSADGSTSLKSPNSIVKIVSPNNNQSNNTNLHTVTIPGKGVQIVRVLNSTASTSKNVVVTSQKQNIIKSPIQQQKVLINKDGQTLTVVPSVKPTIKTSPVSNAPRILNQSFNRVEKIKIEPTPDRPLQVVKKVSSMEHLNSSDDFPPPKKTKYITLTSSQINQIQGAQVMGGGKSKKIVMLPSNYREQLEKLSVRPSENLSRDSSSTSQTTFKIVTEFKRAKTTLEIDPVGKDTGTKKVKRPCNCTKSQCLKFYCECFAAGEYCQNCNCKDCLNEGDSLERQKAVKMCMERNPYAFKSKLGTEEQQRLHQRGCNCKRSGCLKNYCECYEAKISCSANCRCLGCKNVDDIDEKMEMELQFLKNCHKRGSIGEEIYEKNLAALKKVTDLNEIVKKPYNFMTQDVIEATVQCMIAQADECQKLQTSKRQAEKLILEEFGRCLVEIIEFSAKNTD